MLHVCGKGNLDASLENTPGYKQFEYLSDELPDAFACADIMLSPRGQQFALRADGAVQARAADPLPQRARRSGAQRSIRSRRAVLAHVMPQSELTAESLPPAIDALWGSRAASAPAALPDADGTQLVLDQIHKYMKK